MSKAARSPIIREQGGDVFYEAKLRHNGRQVKRRIGPAWLERDPDSGKWRPRRGRVRDGFYDRRGANVAADRIVAAYVADAANVEQVERERKQAGVTFREVASGYLRWLGDVKGAKPATLADHRYALGETGIQHSAPLEEGAR